MEETETTIHSRLTRRNNFLRENPQRGHFVARESAKRHQGFTEGLKVPVKCPKRVAMATRFDSNDSARSGAPSSVCDATVRACRQALRGAVT